MGIIGRGGKEIGERTGATIVAAGTQITGDITLNDSFHLDGSLIGNIQSEGDVSIGNNGRYEGDLNARHVVVSGEVTGNISCDRLEIVANGKVNGEIEVGELVIEAGGQFSGASRIKDSEPKQLSYKSVVEMKGEEQQSA